jgi:hypothetical protein
MVGTGVGTGLGIMVGTKVGIAVGTGVGMEMGAAAAMGRTEDPDSDCEAQPRSAGGLAAASGAGGVACGVAVMVGCAEDSPAAPPLMTGFTWMREPLPKIKAKATARRLTQSRATAATTASTHNSVRERFFSGLGASSVVAATESSCGFSNYWAPA